MKRERQTAGESALIDAFLRPFGLRRQGGTAAPAARPLARSAPAAAALGVLVGPGSDCAVLQPHPGHRLVATTDALFEGVHFDFSYGSAEDAGHKALAVNLSDLAAAGAHPRWFLCALGVPRGAQGALAIAAGLGRGMAALALEHGCALAGGNVTAAKEWSLTITALGEARAPLTRAGGRPGDLLVLAGRLGEAALGLRALRREPPFAARPGKVPSAVRAQLRPEPLVDAGLAAAGRAAAGIDISDGLFADLGHLAQASRCGAELDCARLPRSPAVRRAEESLAGAGAHPYSLSLTGGEDYALLFATHPDRAAALLAALHAAGSGAQVVGRLTKGEGVRLHQRGHPLAAPVPAGFDHLARR